MTEPRTQETNGEAETTGTVLLAGGANLAIAVAKAVGGVLSGSSAMLAEAAHSVGDTLNQVFLLASLRRSQKPSDADHPFGYGMERYFWSLLAAVGIFVLGAGFAAMEGIRAIWNPEPLEELLVAYLILAVSFVFESISWAKAASEILRAARAQQAPVLRFLRATRDPTAKTVLLEDSAALVGLLLAAGGIALHHATGAGYWDGVASLAIAALLAGVAYMLGQQNKSMLIGRSVSPSVRRDLTVVIEDTPDVDHVVELLTLQLAPDRVLLAARVDLRDTMSGADVERRAQEIDRRVQERFPQVRHVFVDPTGEAEARLSERQRASSGQNPPTPPAAP